MGYFIDTRLKKVRSDFLYSCTIEWLPKMKTINLKDINILSIRCRII